MKKTINNVMDWASKNQPEDVAMNLIRPHAEMWKRVGIALRRGL